mgnify:CR=1 FL=1
MLLLLLLEGGGDGTLVGSLVLFVVRFRASSSVFDHCPFSIFDFSYSGRGNLCVVSVYGSIERPSDMPA